MLHSAYVIVSFNILKLTNLFVLFTIVDKYNISLMFWSRPGNQPRAVGIGPSPKDAGWYHPRADTLLPIGPLFPFPGHVPFLLILSKTVYDGIEFKSWDDCIKKWHIKIVNFREILGDTISRYHFQLLINFCFIDF